MLSFDLKNKKTWFFIGGIIILIVILFFIFTKFLKKKSKRNKVKNNGKNFYSLTMIGSDEEEEKVDATEIPNTDEKKEESKQEKINLNVDMLPMLIEQLPKPQIKLRILDLIMTNYSKLIQEFAEIKSSLPQSGEQESKIDDESKSKIPDDLQEKINEYNVRAKLTYEKLKEGLDSFTNILLKELKQIVQTLKNKTTTEKGVPFAKELSLEDLLFNLSLNINTLQLNIEIFQKLLDSNILSKNLKNNIIQLIDQNELLDSFSDFYSFYVNYSKESLLKGAKFPRELQENINETQKSFKKLINFIPLPNPPLTSLEINIPQQERLNKDINSEINRDINREINKNVDGIEIPPQQPLDLNRNNFPSQIRRSIPLSDLTSIVENGKIGR